MNSLTKKTSQEALYCVFSTQLGWFAVRWSQRGINRISIGHITRRDAEQSVAEGVRRASVEQAPSQLPNRLIDFAQGNVREFRDVRLDLPSMTEFQRCVLECCRDIRYGETLSYGQLATVAGSPRAARAVGNVMSKNRFPIVIPCHRVVGSNDGIGGFSAPNGISLKERMLANECSDARCLAK